MILVILRRIGVCTPSLRHPPPQLLRHLRPMLPSALFLDAVAGLAQQVDGCGVVVACAGDTLLGLKAPQLLKQRGKAAWQPTSLFELRVG